MILNLGVQDSTLRKFRIRSISLISHSVTHSVTYSNAFFSVVHNWVFRPNPDPDPTYNQIRSMLKDRIKNGAEHPCRCNLLAATLPLGLITSWVEWLLHTLPAKITQLKKTLSKSYLFLPPRVHILLGVSWPRGGDMSPRVNSFACLSCWCTC